MEGVVTVIAIAGVAAVTIVGLRRLLARVVVWDFERGLRYDDGRFVGVLNPGRYWLLRHRSSIVKVDTRATILTVPGQEVITADGVSIRTSVAAEYQVYDPAVAVNEHGDYRAKVYLALQLALRNAVARMAIDDLLERRAELGGVLASATRDDVARLGIHLLDVEAKDFMFPGELRRTFAQVVAARKEGLAALERARGESAALRNLANAARMIEGNPALMQLRLFQEIGRTGGNTVVLGLPTSATPLPLREPGAHPVVEASPELPPTDE